MGEKKTEFIWINAAKFVAILAVITDHAHQRLYNDYRIAWASYFSVSLFVLLSGITSYYSCHRHKNEAGVHEFVRRAGKVIPAYAAATFLYQIAEDRFWDLELYIDYLFNFNASGPFYFIAFYIQLVAVSPLLYRLIHIIGKAFHKVIMNLVLVSAVMSVSILCFNYTIVDETLYGGAKYLFGASYLFLFYLGMLFGSMDIRFTSIKKEVVSTLTALIAVVFWYCFTYKDSYGIDRYIKMGNGSNPPGVTLIIYGILVCFLLFSLFSLMQDCPYRSFNRLAEITSRLGRYSMYIFLFHRLALDYLLIRFDMNNGIVKTVIYFGTMIVFPVIAKKGFDYICERIKKV